LTRDFDTNKTLEGSHETAEQVAEHICFLADANQLYDHALGIYDLDVALLIAQQSQKVSGGAEFVCNWLIDAGSS
jgi:IKI3 family